MCRIYGFRANEETKVECTLVHAQNALILQSRSDSVGRAHPDGWGIACYEDGLPQLERRALAAFDDLEFSSTAERIYAKTVVAHVRLATVGLPRIENCHPFQVGVWTFAHNGTVTAFQALRDSMQQELTPQLRAKMLGDTDSESLFLWLLSRLLDVNAVSLDGSYQLDRVRDAIAAAMLEVDCRCRQAGSAEPARLNTILTNGKIMVATCLRNSLCWVQRRDLHDCEICGIPHVHHSDQTAYRAVVLASEPLSEESWQAVPDASILTIDERLQVEIRPLQPAEQ